MQYNPTDREADRLAMYFQTKGVTSFTLEEAKTFDAERRTDWIRALLRRLIARGIVEESDDQQFQIMSRVEPRKIGKGRGRPKKIPPVPQESFLSDPEIQKRLTQLCLLYETWSQYESSVRRPFQANAKLAQFLDFRSVNELNAFLEACERRQMVFTRVGQGYGFLGDFVLYFEKQQRILLKERDEDD